MATVTIHNAKTHLSQLIARVESGEEIILARGSKPVAKLVPLEPVKTKRQYGAYRGKISFSDSFFDPMSEEELALWEK